MINLDLLLAAKNLLDGMGTLRTELDALNIAFMCAMEQDDKKASVRALFPNIIESSEKSAAIISQAFLSVNWEKEGNKPQVLYDILSGIYDDLPEDLKEAVAERITGMETTEKEMINRFGEDPMMSAIRELGLIDELADLINAQDEAQALSAVLNDTQDVPLAIKE